MLVIALSIVVMPIALVVSGFANGFGHAAEGILDFIHAHQWIYGVGAIGWVLYFVGSVFFRGR